MNSTIVYGSTMGNTQNAAKQIQAQLGGDLINVSDLTEDAIAGSDLLVLGTSTWGVGDLQDDWNEKVDLFHTTALDGKKVALFGLGDQEGYGDTFVDGMGLLYRAVKASGAQIVGMTSNEGYSYSSSEAEVDGKFAGLVLDDDNQSEMTEARITEWVASVKKEMS